MAQTAPQFDWESARPVDEEPQQPAAAPATADDTYPGAPLAEKQTAAPLSPALFDWESARPVEAAQDFDMESAAPLKELAEDPSYLMSREQFRAHRKDAKETESAVADFLGGLPGVVPGLYSITTGTIGELGQQVAQNWYRPDKLLASLTANQNEGVRRMALSYAKMVDYVGQNLRDMDINRKREAAYGEQLRQKMQQEGKLTGDPIKDHEAVMQALFAAKDAGEIPLTDEQVAEDEERAYQDYWRGKNFDQAIGNITNIKIAGMDATTPSMEWGARNIVTGEYVAPGKFSPDAVGMGIDPANILAAGIGSLARVNALRRAGILLGKGLGPTGEVLSKTGAAIGRGADAVTQRIQLATGGQRVGEKVIGGLSPEMQAYGGATSAAAVGYMTGGDTPLDQAMTGALALLPTVRMVGGTLRKAGTAANAGWIITREMDAGAMSAARADAAKGLAANSAIPERYAKFIRGEGRASADSTLRRVAQDQANPRLLRSLSQFGDNVGLTSAVRATDDAIGGALVGASATVPFALAAPEPEQAGGIIGMGLMLGGAGGVVGGKLTRVAEMQDAMVARMLVDAQASGGNADAFSRLPHQDLVSLAGLQAFSRGKLTFKPLTTSEYRVNLDVTKRRGENSAGFYVETADDGTSTVFINMGEPSAVAGVVSKIRPVTKGGKTIEVRDKDGNSTFTYVPNESRIAVKQGDSVGVGSPLTRGTPSRLSVPEEIAHAIFSSKAMDGLPRDEMRNYINQRYKTEGVAARGREYAARIVDQDIAAGVYGAADSIDDAARDRLVEQRFTEFSQASIEDGADPLDWARDEIIAASLRASVQGIDLARLRNQSNFSRLAEQVVASSAQALRVLGVDVDKMGRVLDPAGTFRDNPVFADPAMRRMVTKYMRDYDQWLAGMEDAGRKDKRGVRVAPSGKVEDYANSQHTVLREIKDANGNGTGVFENDVVTRGADGVVRPKKQSDIDRTEVSRAAQIKSLWDAGKTVPTASAEFGKRRVNGRDIVGGPTLPKQWDLFTQFPQWIREFARQLEAGRGDGRTWIADYNAIGTGSSGRYRVTNLGNIEAILREVAFVGWQVTKKNHLLATVFDMNAFRAAAKRAIDNGELGEMGNNMDEVNATLLQYLDNHKNGRPGEYGIGQTKKNILNGLIGTGTAKQTAANPFYAELNPRGSVRTFRVDRLNDLRDTGRTGYNFMYEPINANMMPDVPVAGSRGMPETDSVDGPNNNRMPSALPQAGMAMPEVAAEPKDVYARSLEDIKAVIPPAQRFVGNRAPGKPVVAPDGRPYLQHDLSKPTGNLFVTQADIDSVWEQSINQAGPSARRAIDVLAKRGIVMRPPNEAHWRATGRLPQSDRFWYETSAEAQVISFPGFAARGESPKVMDTTAATSVMADPNYNAELTISFLSEDLRGTPAQTPAVVPKGVSDALIGTFGQGEQRKIGSFGGTFRFLAGLTDDPPLTTNDRQVAASFNVPDKVFGEFPILYEVATRFYGGLRDMINAGPADKSMGPFEGFQLQALSWVQTRAESRMNRRADIAQQEAFDGDPYPVAFMRAADKLREGGVDVPRDAATGLPVFTDAVLSDPRVTEILAPTAKDFMRDTFQTMEIVTKLTKTGDRFSQLYDESKALGVKGNIKDADAVIARGMNALMTRKDYVDPEFIKLAMQVGPDTPYSIASSVLEQMESRGALRAELGKKGAKATSILTDLARVFDPRAEETTRIEFGLGTFQGDFSQNLRIPLGSVPEQYRAAYLAILGKPYAQAAQAASSFISTAPGGTPTSYSVFFRGRVDPEFLSDLAKDLSAAGHEANVSIRPNGIVVDVMPQFGDAGPVPIDPKVLKELADDAVGNTTTASVIDRDFSSIYLERPNYAGEINKAKKGLLNDSAREIQKATGATLKAARDFAAGTRPELSGNKAINRRAEKARDRYRQRLSQLESVQARLRDMAKEFERDMAKANKVMEQKLERARKAKKKPAQPAPAGLDDL